MLIMSEYKKTKDLFLKQKELKEELEKIEIEIKEKEKEILNRMFDGEVFTWCWDYVLERRNISWKNLFIKYNGKVKAEMESDKVKPTIYYHIGVKGIHNKEEK